jgi:hypothetical protein
MAEVVLQLIYNPFWLCIGSLDETRCIFGAAIQLQPTFVIRNRLLSCEMISKAVDYTALLLRSRR